MQESLIAALIDAARECDDGDVRLILTPRGDGKPTFIGTIDLGQSHSKIVSLRAVALDGEKRVDGPTYRFPRACVEHVVYAGEREGEPLYWFIIEGNHSLTGVRISSDEFFKLNDRDNGGCWPSGFTHEDPNIYIYLKAVEFEGGLVSRDIAFGLDEINCCGERG